MGLKGRTGYRWWGRGQRPRGLRQIGYEGAWECRKFRGWGCTMLLREPSYAATQTAFDPG